MLCERLGHHVEETPAPVEDQFGVDFLRYWAFVAFSLRYGGAAVFGRPFDGRATEPFTRGLAGLFVRSPERLAPAVRRLRRLAREHERGFDRYDVLLSPVLGHETPPIGHLGPDVPFRTHLLRLLRYTSFTPLQNVTGSPASRCRWAGRRTVCRSACRWWRRTAGRTACSRWRTSSRRPHPGPPAPAGEAAAFTRPAGSP